MNVCVHVKLCTRYITMAIPGDVATSLTIFYTHTLALSTTALCVCVCVCVCVRVCVCACVWGGVACYGWVLILIIRSSAVNRQVLLRHITTSPTFYQNLRILLCVFDTYAILL